MSHDIRALDPQYSEAEYRQRLDDATAISEQELERVFAWLQETMIASRLSYAAGNPRSCCIYSALRCEQCHAGCSGDGSAIWFSFEQIADAFEFLAGYVAPGWYAMRYAVLHGSTMIIADRDEVAQSPRAENWREIKFLAHCMAAMADANRRSIYISFQ